MLLEDGDGNHVGFMIRFERRDISCDVAKTLVRDCWVHLGGQKVL